MSSKRIEQLIDDIYEYIESCKPVPFNGSKIQVQKDDIYDFLDELRLKVPEEIVRCQKIIANRDGIISDAENKAVEIENAAREQAQKMIEESEIMQQAYYQANELVQMANAQARDAIEQANLEASQIRNGSLAYSNDMLAEIEERFASAYDVVSKQTNELLAAMQQKLKTIAENRMELNGEEAPAQRQETGLEGETEQESLDGYNFDENTFLPPEDDEEE